MIEITQALLSELFDIDLEVGRFVWRKPPKCHPRMLGKEAGGPRPNSHNDKIYWVIRIGGTGYKRGRLVFFAANGRWPAPCLDHINGDSLDDRLANVREATITENAQNHKRRARRIALPMGVRLIAGSGNYQARISFNGKQHHLGAFATPAEAHAEYLAKRKEFYREFA